MATIRDILRTKSSDMWSVTPDATVYDALVLMNEKNIGAVPVVRDGKVLGILSERDYARKVILKGKHSQKTTVEELMSSPVLYVSPDTTTEECMAIMTDKRIRHVLVCEGDKTLGVISIGDVVKKTIDDQAFIIEQLAQYIQYAD